MQEIVTILFDLGLMNPIALIERQGLPSKDGACVKFLLLWKTFTPALST